MNLSEEKLNEIALSYERNGYVLVRGALSEEEMAPIIAQWQRLRDPLRAGKTVDGIKRDGLYVHGKIPPPMGNIIYHPGITAIVKKLLGPDIAIYFNRLNVKDQSFTDLAHLHQDLPYFNGGGNKINFFIALQDTNVNNGAMIFVPGSHRLGLLDRETIDVSKHPEFEVLVPSLRPGDLVIADILLWHGSVTNMQATDRVLVQMVFQPANDGSYYPANVPEPTLIAGQWRTNEFTPWKAKTADTAKSSAMAAAVMSGTTIVSTRSILKKCKAAVPVPVKLPIKRMLSSARRFYINMFRSNAGKEMATQVADYWTQHNVTKHRRFASRAESLEYFHWRCDQYPKYLDLMPVKGFDGKSILDLGCGPGDDLVGFLEFSKPAKLVGADVSSSSLKEAEDRLSLHDDAVAEFVLLDPETVRLPFEDHSFDYVHSSGVLHHVPNLVPILKELRRVLKPDGICRVMVYNYNSVFLHLHVAYTLRLKQGAFPLNLPIREAFARSTDGPDCPISNCYTHEEFGAEAAKAGFACRVLGAAYSECERHTLTTDRYAAFLDQRFGREHREFLTALTFDETGQALYKGIAAGGDLILELTYKE